MGPENEWGNVAQMRGKGRRNSENLGKRRRQAAVLIDGERATLPESYGGGMEADALFCGGPERGIINIWARNGKNYNEAKQLIIFFWGKVKIGREICWEWEWKNGGRRKEGRWKMEEWKKGRSSAL